MSLSPEFLRVVERHRSIRDILWYEWDPIGVNTNPRAYGEYDTYVPMVDDLISRGASEVELLGLLRQIETDYIGLSDHPERVLKRRLIAARFAAIARRGGFGP
jgi:hypothetical protein